MLIPNAEGEKLSKVSEGLQFEYKLPVQVFEVYVECTNV